MTENPLQKLTPRKLSHRSLVRSGWAGFVRADIIGTFALAGMLSEAITASEAEILGHQADISHTMRYLGRGQVLDQQATLQVRSLEDYIGYIVRVYHNPAYSLQVRNTIVAESLVWHGTAYDLRIIGAHLAEVITGEDGLAERLHDPDRFDCSEGICLHERYGNKFFLGNRPCQVMPEEIDSYCIRAGWQIRTYALVD
jgi:hypothetical protein